MIRRLFAVGAGAFALLLLALGVWFARDYRQGAPNSDAPPPMVRVPVAGTESGKDGQDSDNGNADNAGSEAGTEEGGGSGPAASQDQTTGTADDTTRKLETYKLLVYEDARASLSAGTPRLSAERRTMEADLLADGSLGQADIDRNRRLIARIAAGEPIPLAGGQEIVVDDAMLEVLIRNQEKRIGSYAAADADSPSPEPAIPVPAEAGASPPVTDAVTLGSTADEVVRLLGEPDDKRNYRYKADDWLYGDAHVRFNDKGQVVGWIDPEATLKLSVGVRDEKATSFRVGDGRAAVIAAMGTPRTIHDYKSRGSSWFYGDARVDFDAEGRVKGWVDPDGTLKAERAANARPPQ